MVSLDSLPGSRAWSRSADTRRCRFDLGGIALELLPQPGLSLELPLETNALLCRSDTSCGSPTLAAATCTLRIDPNLKLDALEHSGATRGAVVWEPTFDGIRVKSHQVLLEIAPVGPAQYVVAARIATTSVLTGMLNMLVTALAELSGGLSLHATAVSLTDRAVLLLGPSGAGKTTAAGLLGQGVECLSNDRVVLVPDRRASGKYWVWSLPVGHAPSLPRCQEAALPLLACLFVAQASAPAVVPMREVEAVMRLRQAVETAIGSDFFEAERLAAVARLASETPSAIAHVALSQSFRTQLDLFLSDHRPRWDHARSADVSAVSVTDVMDGVTL